MNAVTTLRGISQQRPIIGFGVVGAISTTIDVTLLYILHNHLGVEIHIATALSFLAGLTNGFFMNSAIVFETERTHGRYFKYFLTSLGGLVITELIVHFLFDQWHLVGALSAKLVAVVIVFFWNYILSRSWTFK